MQSCVMDFSVLEEDSMVGAGSLVLGNTIIKSGELWTGRPAKKVRMLKPGEIEFLKESAKWYSVFARRHKETGIMDSPY